MRLIKSKTKIALLVGLSLVFLLGLSSFKHHENYFEIAKNLDIFATLYQEVNAYYVDDLNPTTVINQGIEAMLRSLDPYTNYIPEDRIEDYRTMTTGEYGGIGAGINNQDGRILITMPFEGFPAHKAGLKIGDQILAVDGVSLEDKNTEEVSQLLKGQSGTEVSLTIQRVGKDKPFVAKLKREKIHINNVTYSGMINEEVGMIRLTDFTNNASKEVKNALLDLKSKGAKKIILDLRGNPGGLLFEAINISNIFLPKGKEIVSTRGKVEDWNKTYHALNPSVDEEIPLIVLISGSSASASEIVAGAIQDYDRGIVIGENSFGKGLVQATRPLSFNAQLKVTVAKYYIPSGRCIQAIDYAHRDEDGNLTKVPDSLRVAFKTKNGRIVYDGGGIKPDIETTDEDYPPILQSLLQKGLIFEYANLFAAKNENISEPRAFKLSDTQYEDFLRWVKGQDYNYTTSVEIALEEIEASAKDEGSWTAIQAQVAALKKAVSHDKERDLKDFQAQIREELEREIATRYYLARGATEASFDDDPDIRQALAVFADPQKFNRILEK
ncbi:MAG: S41 family peptidase [Bernardetiaceae bacterium]